MKYHHYPIESPLFMGPSWIVASSRFGVRTAKALRGFSAICSCTAVISGLGKHQLIFKNQ